MQTTNSTPCDESFSQPAPSIAASSSATNSSADPQYVTLGTTLVLCVLTAVITLMLAFYAPVIAAKRGISLPGASAGSKVVSLDFEKVIAAGIKRSMDSAVGVADIQGQAEKFQSAITAAVKTYSDAGYIIINSKALIGAAQAQDITGDIIKGLGLQP